MFPLDRHSREAALLRRIAITGPLSYDERVPRFADSCELIAAIDFIERQLDKIDEDQLQDRISDLTTKLAELKKKQIARKANSDDSVAG